jgi:hypothetical protein
MKKTWWKNNLNIVKDLLMIHVTLIAIGTIVSEKM